MAENLNHPGKYADLLPPDVVRGLHLKAKRETEEKLKQLAHVVPTGAKINHIVVDTLKNMKTYASQTSISELKLTSLPELIVDEFTKGKYILVRVIEEWYAVNERWRTVIEDHLGHVIAFTLLYYPLDEKFSSGDAFVLKEPYLRLSKSKMPIIRCDCPTSIIVLRPSHPMREIADGVRWKNKVDVIDPLNARPLPTDSLQWKARGNDFFARGQLILAREAYDLGFKMCANDDPFFKIMLLNLLAVQLRLGYFEWVVKHGEIFLQKFPEEDKAYFRLGKAYHMLRNYEKAMETYEKFGQKFPEDELGLQELEKSKKRIREAKGDFDFEKLRRISLAKPREEIDCADFVGPVKITKVSGKGLGLVLTEGVNKGSVLVVSKAIAADFNAADFDENDAANITRVIWLIMKNPIVYGSQVYELYSGKNQTHPPQLFCHPEQQEEPISDAGLIKSIFELNRFKIVDAMNGETKGKGLFLLPSYINHSCMPNAETEFYNDVMVVKALRDMREGTELTVAYVPPDVSFEERTELIAKRGFKCRCPKCKRRR